MANETARALRKRQTIAEALLWDELRELRRQGYHFRKQAPLAGFIVDFACFAQRLVIEVDGVHHETDADQRLSDSARDAALRNLGFNVLRISNGDVMDNRDGVMLDVSAALGAVVSPTEMTGRSFPPPPVRCPQGGGGRKNRRASASELARHGTE